MKKIYLFLTTFWFSLSVFAQGETNIWYFGALAGVDFNSGTPVALTNSALSTSEGSASISDKNGNLLFYTDGIRVWNRNHVQMPNGFGLLGDPSSAQSGIIVPKPGSSTSFYIFTVAAQGNPGGFCYSEVDLTLAAGLGDVIAGTKNTQLFTPSLEKCTAVKHANGLYIWVLGHEMNNNRYHAYLIDCSGVNPSVTTDVGSVEGWPGWGCLTASPDGSKIACAMRQVGFEVLDFNNATGVVSNPVFLGNTTDCYGICFSPDNHLLYGLKIGNGDIYQWNLQAGSPAAIVASATFIATAPGTGAPYRGGTLQLGPDGRIYMPHYQQPFLAAITNPNALGLACNYQTSVVDLAGRNAILGLPPFIQSYFDTTDVIVTAAVNCAGSPTQFSIASGTAFLDSVKWNFGNPSTGTLNTSTLLSPSHLFSAAGNYTVEMMRYLGCIADTTNQTITITGPVTSSQNVTICPNSTYTTATGNVVSTAGAYADTVTAASGCDSIVITNLSIANFSINAGADAAICTGDSTQLNASGGALIFSWSPAAGLSNANVSNPKASPANTTTYVVSSQTPIGNLMTNGDFSAGNTGFSSNYNYTTNNTTEGQYYVGPNAAAWNGGMSPCGDHTTGSGNMLCVNGATTANVSIYCQTINVLPNTTYAFSTWLQTLSPGNLAQLQFSINGNLIGAVFTAPAATCVWQQFYTTWNSGANTTATICIVNQNTNAGANDFALDDMSFAQLCTATDTVVVTVNPVYANTVNATICQNEIYTLPGGNTVNTQGTYVDTLSTINGCDSVITTNLTVNPTYAYSVSQTICPSDLYVLPGGNVVNTTGVYVDTLSTVNGCDSIITTNLTVVPPAITVSNDTAICLGNSVQLNASGGLYSYSWTPTTTLDNAAIANPVATPTVTTSYIVTTQVASGDLIGNGDFEGGNAGFSSAYTYQSNLNPESTYYVGQNPTTYHSGFASCPDHTTGVGNMMIINGSGTPNTNVWCQTINVVPNTNYAFGAWVQSVVSGSPAILQFEINGVLLGAPFNAPGSICTWQQFYSLWNSGANTMANICIINQNTNTGGNDFAIDDVSFIGLCNVSDTVTITVHNPSTLNVSAEICQGATYTFPDGGTSMVSVIDTSLLQDQYGCDSTIITNLTVHPSFSQNVFDTICSNQNYTLPTGVQVNASGIYNDTLLTVFGCDSIIITNLTVHPVSATSILDTICTGSNYTLPDGNTVSSTGVYAVTLQNQFGCDSIVTTTLTVITVSLSNTAANVLCNGGSDGSISALATGGVNPYTFDLYDNAASLIESNNTGAFNTLTAGNYVLNVADDFGCTVTSNISITEPTPLLITDSSAPAHCFGESNGEVFLSASGAVPAYSFNLNGSTNSSGYFNALSAGNYSYTITDANACFDTASVTVTEPLQVLVNVNPDSATINLSESIQLHASSNYDPAATYQWTPAVGLDCYDCANPTASTYQSIDYVLQVSVNVNGNICTAQQNVSVTVVPRYDIFIPNTFTPNYDGNNDFFQIFGNLPALKFMEVKIFNRLGEKVFESNDLNFKWDGSYQGQPLSPAVFVYTLRAVFVDNFNVELYTGSLTLIK